MGILKTKIGDRFGTLTVISKAEDYITPCDGSHRTRWLCKCDCGNEKIILDTRLRSGIKSCGHCKGIVNIGNKYGRLTVINRVEDYITPCDGHHRTRWLCKCDCGNTCIVLGTALITGHTKSCGCYGREQLNKAISIHGLCHTKIYTSYRNMIERCYRINSCNYSNYGGRGITICDQWYNPNFHNDPKRFKTFYNWALNNGWKDGYTLDRIDPNGNYCPENCRWIPREYQAYNKRNNKYINFNGEKYTLSQLSNILGIPDSTLNKYLKEHNWDFNSLYTYIPDIYGNLKPYICNKRGQIIPINAIYFVDEYGFPVNMNEYE